MRLIPCDANAKAIRSLAALALLLSLIGCGGSPALLSGLPRAEDAPYELGNDDDLDARQAQLEVLTGVERSAARRELVAEYTARAERAARSGARDRAFDAVRKMASLFTPREIDGGALARELGGARALLADLLASFSRSGSMNEAAGLVALLREIDPSRAPHYTGEMATIFAYADDLYRASYGPGAERAKPIEILSDIARYVPSAAVMRQLTRLCVARQRAISRRILRRTATFDLVRAHGAEVVRAAWFITARLARAQRLGDAPAALARIRGLGEDEGLEHDLAGALAPGAPPSAWLRLAGHFRPAEDEDGDEDLRKSGDPDAELSIVLEGIRRHPRSPELHLAAGNIAFELERVPLALVHLEAGLRGDDGHHRRASERLAALYEQRVVSLAAANRVRSATATLARFRTFHARARERYRAPFRPDLAAAYASMGQGLVTLGDLSRATRYLAESIRLRPSLEALELSGRIEMARGKPAAALATFERALALPRDRDARLLSEGRLMRLAGEAARGLGDETSARRYRERASRHWAHLLASYELPPGPLAELFTETARLQWSAGHHDGAVASVRLAVQSNPDSAGAITDAMAFLIGHHCYDAALDLYHGFIDGDVVGDDMKLYMSLWLVAEAKNQGRDPDRFATQVVAAREGERWPDVLARYASGSLHLADAERRATTARQKTELRFYRAVLGERRAHPVLARQLLREVRRSDLILDFEHELARQWLAHGWPQAGEAAASPASSP